MSHTPSAEDRLFQSTVESCLSSLADFGHRGHLRLAYVYLADHDVDSAHELMRLDSKFMMTHYSAELIFSDEAREQFVQPDLSPIPDHER